MGYFRMSLPGQKPSRTSLRMSAETSAIELRLFKSPSRATANSPTIYRGVSVHIGRPGRVLLTIAGGNKITRFINTGPAPFSASKSGLVPLVEIDQVQHPRSEQDTAKILASPRLYEPAPMAGPRQGHQKLEKGRRVSPENPLRRRLSGPRSTIAWTQLCVRTAIDPFGSGIVECGRTAFGEKVAGGESVRGGPCRKAP
jgi:hypothetical protein